MVRLLARELLRLRPEAKIAVFYACETSDAQLYWDVRPSLLSHDYRGSSQLRERDDWVIVAMRDGRALVPDRELEQAISQCLHVVLARPETDEDILVLDLVGEVLIQEE